jgi:hypothetical protein
MIEKTMSGPATRPNVVDASDAFATTSSEPMYEPVQIPMYQVSVTFSTSEGRTVLHATVNGTARSVEQIMHTVSDTFREEAEP